MDSLIKTGIFVFLITEVIGSSLVHQSDSNTILDAHEILQNDCECDWRYFKHYEIKGCQLKQINSCGCPVNYFCPTINESSAALKVCVYKNVEYQVGTKLRIEGNCKVCKCVQGLPPRVVCRERECPQLDAVEGHNCHLVYDKHKCCPSRYECTREISAENYAESSGFACHFNNVTYPLGAKIYPPGDPCQVCECTTDWNGINNSSCHQQECVHERYKHYLTAGCVPVYHETKCCPIEFYCPMSYHSIARDTDTSSDNEVLHTDKRTEQCFFDGNSYDIGKELPTNNSCIKCSCRVPPDFTCIHRNCPTPPHMENCYIYYNEDECCPEYDCRSEDVDDANEGNGNNTASTPSEIDCPTPVCEDGSCHVGIPEGFTCPTCICEDSPERNDLEAHIQVVTDHFEGEGFEEALQEQNQTEEKFSLSNASHFGAPETYAETSHKRRRRSENSQASSSSSNSQVQWNILQQDQLIPDSSDYVENTDREFEDVDESNEDFDEMTAFGSRSRMSTDNSVELDETEYDNVNWEAIVPGCPSPMCANSSCRIGIPQGHTCPTCICKKRGQPR